TNRIVIQVRHRFVEIVKYLRLPASESLQDILRQLQSEPHRVAVVVVSDVMPPVDERRPVFFRVREVPVVNIDLPIAPVDFDDRSNQGNDSVAYGFYVRAFVDCESIGKLHESGWRAGLRRVNSAGYVIDRR